MLGTSTPILQYSITPFFNGDHDVTAASRPVTAFVPVRIRLVTPISSDVAVRRLQLGISMAPPLKDVAGDRPQPRKPELRVHVSLQHIEGKIVGTAECPDCQRQEQRGLKGGRFRPQQPRRSERDDEEENSFQPDQFWTPQVFHSHAILGRRGRSINPIAPGLAGGARRSLNQFRWAEVRGLSLQTEGVVAHRERAAGRESGVAGSSPTCEAPYLRQHLSIEFFRRAVELGLSAKRETASGFKSRPSRQYGWVPSSLLVRRVT